MQGNILSAGSAQGIILGDDGVRYTFTPAGWRDPNISPQVGMRVDFEVRGSHAVGLYPVSGSAPPSSPAPAPGVPSQPPPHAAVAPPTVSSIQPTGAPTPVPSSQQGAPPVQPPPPERRRFGSRWWHWTLAGVGVVVVALVVVGAFFLELFGSSGPPEGREIARHTHEGRTYVLVEYGNELAIFSESGSPVGQPDLAEEILRSYVWREVIQDFEIEQLNDVAQRVQRMDDSVSDLRGLSNGVVSVFDQLYDMEATVPLLGSVSAMDIVRESLPAVGYAEDRIRSLDSELNDLRNNAASLTGASRQIRNADLLSVSGKEMNALFAVASEAATDLEGTAGSVQESVSQVEDAVGDLSAALRAGSDTPLIGDALGGFARQAERFESELSSLSTMLGGLESDLGTLGGDLEGALESAENALRANMERWLVEPYDAQWPPPADEDPAAGKQKEAVPTVAEQSTTVGQQAAGSGMESQ